MLVQYLLHCSGEFIRSVLYQRLYCINTANIGLCTLWDFNHFLSAYTKPTGSCVSADYTACCTTGYCAGYPANCFCDRDCHARGDCCSDTADICEDCECHTSQYHHCSLSIILSFFVQKSLSLASKYYSYFFLSWLLVIVLLVLIKMKFWCL